MATAILDQSMDLNGQELYRITNLYGAPDYVKQASADRVCGTEALDPHMYADPVRKLYPCHTAPAVWASTAFFAEKRASLPEDQAARVAKRLAECGQHFGILPDLEDLKTKIASATSTDESQLPDDVFAIVLQFDDGHKERRYPMRNAPEVRKAAAYLSQYRDQFLYDDRRRVADKVLQKAAEYGANVAEWRDMLEKTAGMGVCAAKDAAELVRSRAEIVKSNEQQLRDQFFKLADTIEENGEHFQHWAPLQKIASIVDQFDHERGLNQNYGSWLDRPEDVLFGVTEKVAMDLSDELVSNARTGAVYKRADLANLDLRMLGDAMGDDFASAISTANAWVDIEKLAAIVPTLPLNDAQTLDSVLMELGIAPFATKSASAGTGISQPELAAVADAHQPSPGGLWDHIRAQS